MTMNYLSDGIEALNTGRPTLLNKVQEKRLIHYIQRMSESEQGDRLTGADIANYIKETFDIEYHLGSVYKLLHRLGFSWITSRSRHPQQPHKSRITLKKLPVELIKKTPVWLPLSLIDY